METLNLNVDPHGMVILYTTAGPFAATMNQLLSKQLSVTNKASMISHVLRFVNVSKQMTTAASTAKRICTSANLHKWH